MRKPSKFQFGLCSSAPRLLFTLNLYIVAFIIFTFELGSLPATPLCRRNTPAAEIPAANREPLAASALARGFFTVSNLGIQKNDVYLQSVRQGLMAERLGTALQKLLQRFESASDLH